MSLPGFGAALARFSPSLPRENGLAAASVTALRPPTALGRAKRGPFPFLRRSSEIGGPEKKAGGGGGKGRAGNERTVPRWDELRTFCPFSFLLRSLLSLDVLEQGWREREERKVLSQDTSLSVNKEKA